MQRTWLQNASWTFSSPALPEADTVSTTSGLAAGFGVSPALVAGFAASPGFAVSVGLGGAVVAAGAVGVAAGPHAASTAPALPSSEARSAARRPYCFSGGGWKTLKGGAAVGSFSPPQQSTSTTNVWLMA